MHFTESQRQAIESRKNIALMAGAGSGKTRVLVERFVALLLENADWRLNNIVAITFTEAAALEMKERVRATLSLNKTARATELLKQIDSARISTIHALCADILRANSALVGLDPKFSVINSAVRLFLIRQSYQDSLEELQQNEADREALNALFLVKTLDTVKKLVTSPSLLEQPIATLKALTPFTADSSHTVSEAGNHARILHRLAIQVSERYRAFKLAQGLVDFSDLEEMALHLLRNEDVRKRYQNNEFKHIMVDEFQDTNGQQWDIVKCIADLNTPNTLFIVGDEKQSIYGFRGADVSIFAQARDEIVESGGHIVEMTESFRTVKPLVDVFNTYFEHSFERSSVKKSKKEAQVSGSMASFFVPFGKPMVAYRTELPEKQLYSPLELHRLTIMEDNVNVLMQREQEAIFISERIQAVVNQGALIYDKQQGKNRPIGYGDFAILTRSYTDLAVYENALDEAQIPYITLSKKNYYQRTEVLDMLSLLKALNDPENTLALAEVLRSPFFGIDDEALLSLRQITVEQTTHLTSLWDALHRPSDSPYWELLPEESRLAVERAREVLDEIRQWCGHVTTWELLLIALQKTGYLATLNALPNGLRLRLNAEKFVTIVQDYAQLTLDEFLEYVEDLAESDTQEGEFYAEGTQSVKIMTIHASKGLEFPIVIVANLPARSAGGPSSILTDEKWFAVPKIGSDKDYSEAYSVIKNQEDVREEAENIRLAYVAFTRAQDSLWLFVRYKKDLSLESKILVNEAALGKVQQNEQVKVWEKQLLKRFQRPAKNSTHQPSPSISWLPSLAEAQKALPLLADVPPQQAGGMTHISATQLNHIAAIFCNAQHAERHKQSLRMSFSPHPQSGVLPIYRSKASASLVGRLVHEALRHWHLPYNTPSAKLTAILDSYAWGMHLLDDDERRELVDRAYRNLRSFEKSRLFQNIENARQQYRELPFIVRTEKRVLHGQMDLLFQTMQGDWIIVDYKTDRVPQQDVSQHVREYYLQVGAYASAVESQLGVLPIVQVHYIHANSTVTVETALWRAELAKLEQFLGEIDRIVESKIE